MILNLDCRVGLAMLPDNSVDAVVCDPPYELSNDGKQSAARVFSEFMFPKNTKIETQISSSAALALFVNEIFNLGSVRGAPHPATTVPVSTVTFDNQTTFWQNDIENGTESTVEISQNAASVKVKTESIKHLGCFALKLTDPAKVIQILNQIGTGFISETIGIGLADFSARIPSLEHCCPSVVGLDDDMCFRRGALTYLISTLVGAAGVPVLSFNVTNAPHENLTANGARLFAAIALTSGAEFVRACAGTSGLSAKFQTRRIRVVDDAANGAFSFDLIVHPQSITSVGFMGKEWDGSKIAYDVQIWQECLRVLKPGGHVLAFSGSRTYHRMAVAIEDAGFTIRDQIMWIYGSGMNKVGYIKDAQAVWPGVGGSIKPAHEPICVGRKPFFGTLLENITVNGVGGFQIDGCRVPIDAEADASQLRTMQVGQADGETGWGWNTTSPGGERTVLNTSGRWPANVIHDGSPEVLAMFPNAKGQQGTVTDAQRSQKSTFGTASDCGKEYTPRDDVGSAARFFYCAKTSAKDRHEGGVNNTHLTVKPTDLMRYLCRLVTPPGGLLVDPFAGSGSTGKAAILEGFQFLGFELDPQYVDIANARIQAAQESMNVTVA